MKRAWLSLLILATMFIMMPTGVFALEQVTSSFQIEYTGPDSVEATILILPQDDDPTSFPKEVTLNNGDSYKVTEQFSKLGTIEYKVYQKKGTDSSVTYDESMYFVRITVIRGWDGELVSVVTIRKGDSDEKLDRIAFENIREMPTPPAEVTPTPVPVPSSPAEPTPTHTYTQSEVPKTGDDNSLALYLVTLNTSIAASIGIAVFISIKDKSRKRVEKGEK